METNFDKSNDYRRIPLKTDIKIKGIYSIHYFKYGQSFSYVGESHNFWEFVFIDSGEAVITANENKFKLSQGEAVFHKPNEYHNISTVGKFANSVIISFDTDSPIMKHFENLHCVLTDPEKTLLNLIITECNACFSDKLNVVFLYKMNKKEDSPIGGEQLIKNYIEQLLISILRRTLSNKAEQPRTKHTPDDLTQRLIEILNSRIYSSITLDELSERLFYSKTYIKTVFKRQTGTTILKYFNGLKIDEAKRLISKKQSSFTEIAYQLNFSSLFYFSRIFKEYTKMTLTEYSNSIKVDNIL